jgi:hypothetical protein
MIFAICTFFFLISATFSNAIATDSDPAFVPNRDKKVSSKVVPASPKALPDGITEPPSYKIGVTPFHDGQRLVFQASWIGIPVATARIELHSGKKTPGMWSAEAWVETNKYADVLFKMRDYVSEDLDQRTLVSRDLYIRQNENKRHNDFKADFDRSTGVVTLVKHNHRAELTKRFISTNPWGPLSGAMLALSLPMAPGQHYAVDVFTGSTRYIFDFKVVAREKITTQLGTFDAYRLIPTVDYESDGKLSQSATGIMIWVSADDRRLPLRAQSQAFIGQVQADLIQVGGLSNDRER